VVDARRFVRVLHLLADHPWLACVGRSRTAALLLSRVRPLNPAPLAITAAPVAPRVADLTASRRRVA
jgi:hypothetical protein